MIVAVRAADEDGDGVGKRENASEEGGVFVFVVEGTVPAQGMCDRVSEWAGKPYWSGNGP